MIVKRASRQSVKPLIGLYAESGCGKTYSALLLARGIVGPSGRIVMIDSEGGRGSLYADVISGGYDTLELVEPFAPARYIEAIQIAEPSADVLIIDSISHGWEGIGGVLDMAGKVEERTGKPGLHCWREPKMAHAKMMIRLLQSPLPIIVCMRAKHKSRQTKNEAGKTVIVRDDFTTPIQADDFIYEMMAHAEILQDHSIRLTKCSHPALRDCFPTTGPITIAHGEAIARWCAAPGVKPKPSGQVESAGGPDLKALKAKLWEAGAKIHGVKKGASKAVLKVGLESLQQYCWDENICSDTESLGELPAKRLVEVIQSLESKA
jgi:hypothetical protein